MSKYATVDELIIILQRLSVEGYGMAEVSCNQEYGVSMPTYEEELPEVYTTKSGIQSVDLGGYC
ncbi:hypothetical protein S140_34 [Shewanella sp. phage 1/40]|uniref:hypothetical protein n=1 Tax=Shewanella sp. phage 1/40 TaxID=1458860 RepID=UPI0004F6F689|nr:hypothetical protein S140_34 [Shewanella sp. phage 1/40]AHK11444.1 hypothetical protein S140_34 [Shewanella sp. phage 1/40]